jgi:hypothetical protein
MVIRHIRPGSDEWSECLGENDNDTRLTPEEQLKLKRLLALESASMGMPFPQPLMHSATRMTLGLR